jgi:protein-L-isoaspartate(D-aspartate) O-methyltransferase
MGRFDDERREMIALLRDRGITDERLLQAMGKIERHLFVSEPFVNRSYDDTALPIAKQQTISQPYIVALMTQELRVDSDCEVLEIGTGSGYQTAILSKLVKKVYTIERFRQLSESAKAVLATLGIRNVEFYVGDGSCGWPPTETFGGRPQEKTFERIMITAAVPKIPLPLLKQLADGGFIVAPVGYEGVQELVLGGKQPAVAQKHDAHRAQRRARRDHEHDDHLVHAGLDRIDAGQQLAGHHAGDAHHTVGFWGIGDC